MRCCPNEADLSTRSQGRTSPRAAGVLDHKFGGVRPHARCREGVHAPGRRTLRPRPAHRHRPAGHLRPRARAADQRRADAVRARDRDARLQERRRRRARRCEAAVVRDADRARTGDARRLGGHASVQPLRAPADHRARPLPQPGRPAPVHRPPRADLRHARARRRRRPREGDPGRERPPPPARPPAGALRVVTVLARRADGPRLESPDGLRRIPTLRAAATVPRLRRLRRGGRPARAHRLHRGLHAHLVGHSAASQTRDGRDPNLRRDHARRGRGRARRLLPGVVKHSRSNTTAGNRSRRTTAS